MARAVHISTARQMLNSGDPVDIKLWKSDGSILEYKNAQSISISYYGGWREMKLLSSGAVRRVRDVCIFEINDCEVYL